jgi:uncharacterized protein YqhQ
MKTEPKVMSERSPVREPGFTRRAVLSSARLFLLEEEILLGGQAVLEGVMMRAPRSMAVAVRRPDGEISILRREIPRLSDRHPILKWPVIRGAAVMIQSLVLGISSLNFSAEAALDEKPAEAAAGDASPQEGKPAGESHAKSGMVSAAIILSVIASVGVGMALFFLLPLALTDLVKRFVPALQNGFVYNLVDGGFRILVFLLYLFGISLLRDIKRVFEYHGAEHKTVFAHEAKEDLTVENVRRHSRLHPRCGTSFLLFVMIVSILVFSILPTKLPFYIMIFPRLALVPLIAGISYEAIRWSARSRTAVAAALVKPGLWMQRLTTREPDDSQIAVAIRALREALEMERRGALPAVPV